MKRLNGRHTDQPQWEDIQKHTLDVDSSSLVRKCHTWFLHSFLTSVVAPKKVFLPDLCADIGRDYRRRMISKEPYWACYISDHKPTQRIVGIFFDTHRFKQFMSWRCGCKILFLGVHITTIQSHHDLAWSSSWWSLQLQWLCGHNSHPWCAGRTLATSLSHLVFEWSNTRSVLPQSSTCAQWIWPLGFQYGSTGKI